MRRTGRGGDRINPRLMRIYTLVGLSTIPGEAYCRIALKQVRVEFIIDVY